MINALVLALQDQRRGTGLSAGTEAALRDLWAKQRRDGSDKGAWGWTNARLEPWEVAESPFFGAALAAVAVGSVPAEYQARPDLRPNIEDLKAYLRDHRETQPLANRLLLLWSAAHMDGLVTAAERLEIIAQARRSQNQDGGWTLAALGPWRARPDAPEQASGSSAYATAWAAFTLRQAGLKVDDPVVSRALSWLRAHQDPGGYWDAASMNKRYEAGSMQERFMRDAATAFAVLALSGGK